MTTEKIDILNQPIIEGEPTFGSHGGPVHNQILNYLVVNIQLPDDQKRKARSGISEPDLILNNLEVEVQTSFISEEEAEKRESIHNNRRRMWIFDTREHNHVQIKKHNEHARIISDEKSFFNKKGSPVIILTKGGIYYIERKTDCNSYRLADVLYKKNTVENNGLFNIGALDCIKNFLHDYLNRINIIQIPSFSLESLGTVPKSLPVITPVDNEDYLDYFSFRNTPRSDQNERIKDIIKLTNKEKTRHVVLDAPTGYGKTAVFLAAALHHIYDLDGILLKVVYCCRTTHEHEAVIKEIKENINRKCIGKHIKCLSIIGKSKMCIKYDQEEDLNQGNNWEKLNQYCRIARKRHACEYYNCTMEKQDDIIDNILIKNDDVVKSDSIVNYIKDKAERACPFYLMLRMAGKVDVICCYYPWIFNENMRMDPFFKYSGIQGLNDIFLIIDETHNLNDIATKCVVPGAISINDINKCMSIIDLKKGIHAVSLDVLSRVCLGMTIDNTNKYKDFAVVGQYLNELSDELYELLNTIDVILEDDIENEENDDYLISLDKIEKFLQSFLKIKENTSFRTIVNKENGFSLEIICLNPLEATKPIFDAVESSVCASGTLDFETFIMMCYPPEITPQQIIGKFPFDIHNTCAKIYTALDSSDRRRWLDGPARTIPNNNFYIDYANLIWEIYQASKKRIGVGRSIGVFCTSKLFALRIRELKLNMICSREGINIYSGGKEVNAFKEHPGSILIDWMQGENSEGVDFPDALMDVVIVCGFPAAPPAEKDFFINEKLNYWNNKRNFGKWGEELFYEVFPMVKAVQSAGRPVRKDTDVSLIIFADKRFSSYNCWRRFPYWIKLALENHGSEEVGNIISLTKITREFFDEWEK